MSPGLSADVTRRTLFGRAITVGGAFGAQRRERLGRVFLNAPTMLGLPVESLLALEQSHESVTSASSVSDISSIAWEQRANVASRFQLWSSYSFERNHTFDPTTIDDPLGFDVTVNIARLNGAAVLDTRDDPINRAAARCCRRAWSTHPRRWARSCDSSATWHRPITSIHGVAWSWPLRHGWAR